MATFITLFVIIVVVYWIMMIISRKKRELTEKELRQKEQFLKETQLVLKMESPSFTSSIISETIQPVSSENYRLKITAYLSAQGYTITESVKAEGIDLIGFKEKELLLVRCESTLKEINKLDLKLFIADCTTYIDKNPMLRGRSCVRFYATNRPLTEEAVIYVRENPASVHLMDEV